MGIFDFLKSKKQESNFSEPKNSEINISETKKLESIFDLFSTDLRFLPDNSFIKGNEEANESENKITNYRKDLNPMELGLFDTLYKEKCFSDEEILHINPKSGKVLKHFEDRCYIMHCY